MDMEEGRMSMIRKGITNETICVRENDDAERCGFVDVYTNNACVIVHDDEPKRYHRR